MWVYMKYKSEVASTLSHSVCFSVALACWWKTASLRVPVPEKEYQTKPIVTIAHTETISILHLGTVGPERTIYTNPQLGFLI